MVLEHWFDFVCPYCYIAPDRNRILRDHGIEVVEHGLRIHPEIPAGGSPAGPRVGPSYDFLAEQAAEAVLPLNWSERMPNTRTALAAFEWLRASDTAVAERFAESVFTAYFAERLDIESVDLLATLAAAAGGDADGLRAALSDGTAYDALAESERRAAEHGVMSTPTWIIEDQTFSGLRPRPWFEELANVLDGLRA
jgi:predicted DsbA family dithiol-disulfide isomerase